MTFENATATLRENPRVSDARVGRRATSRSLAPRGARPSHRTLGLRTLDPPYCILYPEIRIIYNPLSGERGAPLIGRAWAAGATEERFRVMGRGAFSPFGRKSISPRWIAARPGSLLRGRLANAIAASLMGSALAGISIGLIGADAAADTRTRVWVTAAVELVYAPDGSLTELRYAWTLDDVLSARALLGLEHGKEGEFTREALAALAEVNVGSLKPYHYFTHVRGDGAKSDALFSDPANYWLDYDTREAVLTLHFTLPLRTPVRCEHLEIEVEDPDLFVEFAFAKRDPVRIIGGPSQCAVTGAGADGPNVGNSPRPPVPEADPGAGAGPGNRIRVTCP